MYSYDTKNWKTGDILLFSDKFSFNPINWFGKLIEFFTKSPYSHIGMIVRDPIWIKKDLKGLFLWESSYEGIPDPQDQKIKLGVQITNIDDILNQKNVYIWYKKINSPDNKFDVLNLMNIHSIVYDKPYDLIPIDWINTYFQNKHSSKKTNRFFCSAFVAFIYTKCGIIDENTNWSIVRPCDFDNNVLIFNQQCFMSPKTFIK
jgi:hypothetical protein